MSVYLEHYASHDKGRAVEFIEMTMRPDFNDAVKKLRKKWDIDVNFIASNTKDAQDEWLRLLEDNKLAKDVKEFLSSLSISPSWKEQVHQ